MNEETDEVTQSFGADDEPEVMCRECGIDPVCLDGEDLCEDCALLWLSRKRGQSVH